jgi:NRAMP (natural resistance-associated macrophage protein)-like metal ion transporter
MADASRGGGLGPGLLVAAAFIGPGTITTASVAGAGSGFVLAWALVFSVVATLVLQEMAARLGIVARLGLSEALRAQLEHPVLRAAVLGLVVVAIGVGNAAYEAGNIIGATLGAAALLPLSDTVLVLVVSALAGALLWSGRYPVLERVLVVLVALMGLVFLATVAVAPPDLSLLLHVPEDVDPFGVTALALVGTTVVPYTLFLHARAVQARWTEAVPVSAALAHARRDAAVSIGLGGLLTLAVMSTAAVALLGTDAEVSAATMARQLEPVLGPFAGTCFALGLLAAGLTSAITAPLAAAWAVCGALGWSTELRAPAFRAVWAVVLGFGTLTALLQTRPVAVILLAQAANALLLPVVAVLLLWIANREAVLGTHRNGTGRNVLAAAVVLVVTLLGGYRLLALLG